MLRQTQRLRGNTSLIEEYCLLNQVLDLSFGYQTIGCNDNRHNDSRAQIPNVDNVILGQAHHLELVNRGSYSYWSTTIPII